MTERLKLKRGLSEISPLFQKEVSVRPFAKVADSAREIVAPARSSTPEVCFIWSADDESDAYFLNNFFASKMATPASSALLLTLENEAASSRSVARPETGNRSLQRIRMPVTCLREAFHNTSWVSEQMIEKVGTQIFLEMSLNAISAQPQMVRVLDHVVLFLKPQVDSVTEAYRQLKYLAALELHAEVTVLFDAEDAGGLPARLYELFSDFVSRRLSLSMNYLGTLHLSRGSEGLRQDIRWESWNATRAFRSESIEKMHFLSWIEKLSLEEVR